MAKKNKKNDVSVAEAVKASHKKANIAVIIVAAITALLLIAIAVMCSVRVDPLDGLKTPDANKSERYELYDLDSSAPLFTTSSAQSKIRTALGKMDFSVMNAVLQWNWDYSYNFARNSEGKKITLASADINEKTATSTEYMVEYIYADAVVNGELDTTLAQKLTVDGETIYFDRVKVLIGNTDGSVGEIYLYPYIYEYATNRVADDGTRYETYKITPVKVRANTTETYNALKQIVTEANNG
ncbi:MAG: hypothetical protein K2K13_07385 [Clostridiales bacterium]|nr:hypothetical protein [Clostridiales bacterium]